VPFGTACEATTSLCVGARLLRPSSPNAVIIASSVGLSSVRLVVVLSLTGIPTWTEGCAGNLLDVARLDSDGDVQLRVKNDRFFTLQIRTSSPCMFNRSVETFFHLVHVGTSQTWKERPTIADVRLAGT